MILNMVGGKLVDQLDGIKGAGGKPQVAFQWQEAVYGLTADYGIQVPPSSQGNQAVSKQFKVPGELASGFSDALGKALNLTQMRGVEGEDAIRLP